MVDMTGHVDVFVVESETPGTLNTRCEPVDVLFVLICEGLVGLVGMETALEVLATEFGL